MCQSSGSWLKLVWGRSLQTEFSEADFVIIAKFWHSLESEGWEEFRTPRILSLAQNCGCYGLPKLRSFFWETLQTLFPNVMSLRYSYSCLDSNFLYDCSVQIPVAVQQHSEDLGSVCAFMASMFVQGWRSMPDLLFSDIMLMVSLENIESLHRCRQVCKTWNEKIISCIWENQGRRKIMKIRIERIWTQEMFPSSDDISHAKWLGNW